MSMNTLIKLLRIELLLYFWHNDAQRKYRNEYDKLPVVIQAHHPLERKRDTSQLQHLLIGLELFCPGKQKDVLTPKTGFFSWWKQL